jgi:hypothetical protein
VARAIVPDYALGSHTASLGLVFYDGDSFPERYRGGAFIGQRGSWNRSEFSGYKVVFVPFDGGQPSGAAEDFLTRFIADAERGKLTAVRSRSRSCRTAHYSSPMTPATPCGASKPLTDDGPRAPDTRQRATSSAAMRWSRFRRVPATAPAACWRPVRPPLLGRFIAAVMRNPAPDTVFQLSES